VQSASGDAAPVRVPVDVPTDPLSVRILDAAYEEFLSLGLRRATFDLIARRAKVGRMTVHRRFGSKQELVAAVLTRENERVVGQLTEVAAAQATVVDALVESLAYGVETVRDSSLFGRLLETDRDDVTPFLTYQAGPLMAETTRFIIGQINEDESAGAHPSWVAEAVFRVCHSALLAPDGLQDLRDPTALREFLRPVITALVAASP
jgi:AcrR family transcriptional regulator